MSATGESKLNTRVIEVDPRLVKLLEVNARFMRHEQYQQLVANIRRDGVLTSTPFYCLNEGHTADEPDDTMHKWLAVSGNHRTKASIDAGLERIAAIVTDDPLETARRTALQLSHNAIEGEDDPAILKQLYDSIEDVDWRVYAALDDKTLGLLADVQVGALSEVNLDFLTLTFTFLPNEIERVQEAFKQAKSLMSSDHNLLARYAEYDKLLEGLDTTGRAHGVTNIATALLIILDIYARHLDDLAEGWLDENLEPKHDGRVPLASLIGTTNIPARSLAIFAKALRQMERNGDVGEANKWQAIEYLAAGYLAEVGL